VEHYGREQLPIVRLRKNVPRLFPRKMLKVLMPFLLPVRMLIDILPFVLRGLRLKADIYHCYHLHGLLAGAIISVLTGKKLVYEGIEDYPYSFMIFYVEHFRASLSSITATAVWKLCYWLELFLVKHFAHLVFTVNSVGGVLYERYKLVSKKKDVIEIWNVPRVKAEVDERLRREVEAKYSGRKLAVYIGAIHKHRGCLNMIKAIKYVVEKIPNVLLLMIGSVTDRELFKEATTFIKQHHLEDNIEFLGFVPYNKLHTYLSVCHLGLTLDIPEHQSLIGTPTKLFLYMRAGLPVIASNLPMSRNIIKIAKCGILVDPTNVKQIAEAIVKLLKNPELAKQMGENGRKAIREKYNWEKEEEKIIRAYEALRD